MTGRESGPKMAISAVLSFVASARKSACAAESGDGKLSCPLLLEPPDLAPEQPARTATIKISVFRIDLSRNGLVTRDSPLVTTGDGPRRPALRRLRGSLRPRTGRDCWRHARSS